MILRLGLLDFFSSEGEGGGSFLRLNPWFSVFVTKSNNELDIVFPDHPPEVEQTE